MPRLDYRRDDLRVELHRAELRVTATIGSRRANSQVALDIESGTLDSAWTEALRDALVPLVPHWTGLSSSDETLLPRIVLRVGDPDLAALPWESTCIKIIGPADGRFAIVRDTPVRPRAEAVGWTLPLRILHTADDVREDRFRQQVRGTFGALPAADIDAAVGVQEVTLDGLSRWRPTSEWPTAEVIHFDQVPALLGPRPLSTAADAEVGALGWLARFTDENQTRLVVVRCATELETRAARRLAQALVDRGGPAFLVLRTDSDEPFGMLYDLLLHDRPLDWIARELAREMPADLALFAGAGREEAIRVSGPATVLLALAEALQHPASAARVERALYDLTAETVADGPPVEVRMAELRDSLESFNAGDLTFHHHESQGYIPSARVLRDLRDLAFGGQSAPVRWEWRERLQESDRFSGTPAADPGRPQRSGESESEEGRVVNLSVSADEGPGAPSRIPQRNARLVQDRFYHLGVQVGSPDPGIRALDTVVILNEMLKLRPEEEGAWLEVAVTGIGFEVVGDPVQDLWLPRIGDTDLLRFTVIPRQGEVSVVRVCLYHRQNLVQSYRLAAIIVPTQGATPGPLARARLAAALGVPLQRVGDAGWLARLEFSRVADPGEISGRPERALSIVTNQINGQNTITVKGADVFAVETPGNLSMRVKEIRDALSEIATPPTEKVRRDLWPYAFGLGGTRNAGNDDLLKHALIRLAEKGWELYSEIVNRIDRDALDPLLKGSDRVIQVAHVLIEKVLPWSLIYDREFTPGSLYDENGIRVEPDACLAALPNAMGELPEKRCGEHEQCLLLQGHRKKEGVVCPLGFWGFRHAVEIPPQQRPLGGEGSTEADTVKAASPVLLVGGLNTSIRKVATHKDKLTGLDGKLPGVLKWSVLEERGHQIINVLDDAYLDVVYLYCHARGGQVTPGVTPYLEFPDAKGNPLQITAGALRQGKVWDHQPLVILNGCGTVGFSPDALSPFLSALVRDRKAAGLLGTEIPVDAELAAEFAEDFLLAFLSGSSAGQAMLNARRKLLAQKNPLGLIYTLYANADLKLATQAIGTENRVPSLD